MSFAPILQAIVDDCGGGVGAALMGNDGIPIEQVQARGAGSDSLEDEIAAAGAEFGRILEEIRKAADAVGGGALLETSVVLSRMTLILRGVDEDNFLVVAVATNGNPGKARYLIRRQLPALRQLL